MINWMHIHGLLFRIQSMPRFVWCTLPPCLTREHTKMISISKEWGRELNIHTFLLFDFLLCFQPKQNLHFDCSCFFMWYSSNVLSDSCLAYVNHTCYDFSLSNLQCLSNLILSSALRLSYHNMDILNDFSILTSAHCGHMVSILLTWHWQFYS